MAYFSCAVCLHVSGVQRSVLAVLVLIFFFARVCWEFRSPRFCTFLPAFWHCALPVHCGAARAGVMVCGRRGVWGHVPNHLESDDAHVSNTFRYTPLSTTSG